MVIGCQGQLGRELMTQYAEKYVMVGVGHDELDITDRDAVRDAIEMVGPEVVLVTAAKANVDWCESHPAEAAAVNTYGAAHISHACRHTGAWPIYFSTDYVFDGNKREPYVESDETNPISKYGSTKLRGEMGILDMCPKSTVLRVSWFYSRHGRGFIRQMLTKAGEYLRQKQSGSPVPIDVVSDQFSNPTWTVDIANQTQVIIECGLTGLFHAGSVGGTSRPDLARFLFRELDLDVEINEVPRTHYPGGGIRPAYSSLQNDALEAVGRNVMRDYQVALREFVQSHRKELLELVQ